MLRRRKQRRPGGIGHGAGVVVQVAIPDGRGGPPEVERDLASQHAMLASDAARYTRAKARAVADRSSPLACISCRATPFQIAEGVPSQKRAISVCSSVRVALVSDPISFTSL